MLNQMPNRTNYKLKLLQRVGDLATFNTSVTRTTKRLTERFL